MDFVVVNKNKIYTKTIVVSLTIVFGLLFITTSFFDREIIEVFVPFLKTFVVKLGTVITYKLGDFIIVILVLPLCLTIILNWIIVKHQNFNFFYKIAKHKRTFLKLFFNFFIVCLILVYIFPKTYELIIYFNDYGIVPETIEQLEIEFLTAKWITLSVELIWMIILISVNMGIYFIFLKKQIDNNSLIENEYIRPALTIILFAAISYLIISVLKHFSGRTSFINVAWTRENATKYGLDPNNSVEAYFDLMNWFFFKAEGTGIYGNAKYFEWYEPNNFKQNWINWFNLPEKIWIDNNDHYIDMDFPSGHMCTYFVTISMSYFFCFSKKYKMSLKLNKKQIFYLIFSIILTIYCFFNLMIQMSHWPSDLFFTMMIIPCLFILSKWITKKFCRQIF